MTIKIGRNVSGAVKVRISGIDGRVMLTDLQSEGGAYNKTQDLSSFPKGVYVIEVQAGNNTAASRLIVQ